MIRRSIWTWGKILAAIALPLGLLGCGPSTHVTQVVLPNGVDCISETHGTLFWESRNVTCRNAQGKVVGSYKSS